MQIPDTREEILKRLLANPVAAHEVVFKHRHGAKSPQFHKIIISDWYSKSPFVLNLLFRGAGKSTIAEEAVVLMASFGIFKNALIIGETETRAKERLTAIKHEFETNEDLRSLFGDQVGTPWQETAIVLKNGVRLQALGRGQSLRGVKHLHYRPDMAILDDLEDEFTAGNDEGRQRTRDWFLKTLLPAMAPDARMRMCATPLHPEALAMRLSADKGWTTRVIPICHIDANTGVEVAAWPDRYSMDWVTERRDAYYRLGDIRSWAQEFMCVASTEEMQLFKPEMIKIEPHVRTWQSIMVAYDPARTVKQTSDFTGKIVGSWVGSKLILWEAKAMRCRPDELVADVMETCKTYRPFVVGVEEDGLNEFVMQPLRTAAARTGEFLPIKAIKAPRDKRSFIKSLHPFFAAGDIVFANDRQSFASLEQQMMAFPQGKIDTLNALAYMLQLRPGLPILPEFTTSIVADRPPTAIKKWWLSFEATSSPSLTVATLMAIDQGTFWVIADWIRDGGAGTAFPEIMQEARMISQAPITPLGPTRLINGHDTTGLVAAARAFPQMLSRGGDAREGIEAVRSMLLTNHNGRPRIRVCADAAWTIRALSGALCEDAPRFEWPRLVGDALFQFAALAGVVNIPDAEGLDKNMRFDYDTHGRKFMTARDR